MSQSKNRAARNHGKAQRQMARTIDALSQFQEFQRDILPALQRAVKAGKSAEDIAKIGSAAAMARAVTLALTEEDSSKALGYIKEVNDRAHGKPGQKTEVTTKFEKLGDEDIDRMVEQSLKMTASLDDAKDETH
jgi:hypothetical protein